MGDDFERKCAQTFKESRKDQIKIEGNLCLKFEQFSNKRRYLNFDNSDFKFNFKFFTSYFENFQTFKILWDL